MMLKVNKDPIKTFSVRFYNLCAFGKRNISQIMIYPIEFVHAQDYRRPLENTRKTIHDMRQLTKKLGFSKYNNSISIYIEEKYVCVYKMKCFQLRL